MSTEAIPALVGLFIAGLGISLQFPLGVALAIAASEGLPDRATARSGIAAGLAIGGGPFVLGALADLVGVHSAFLLVPVLLALAALFVRLARTVTPVPTEGGTMTSLRPRWDTDRRYNGIADASAMVADVERLLEAMRRPGWVTEDPDAHLLPHLERACAQDGSPWTLLDERLQADGDVRHRAWPCSPGQ